MAPTEEWKSSRFSVLCPLCGLMQHNFLNEKFPFATDFLRCHGNHFFWGRRKCGNSWRIFPFPLLRKKRPPSIGVGLPRLNGKLVAFFLLVFFFFWSFFLAGMVPHQTTDCFFSMQKVLMHEKGVMHTFAFLFSQKCFSLEYTVLCGIEKIHLFLQPFLEEVVPHQSQNRQNNGEKWEFFCIIFAKMVHGKAVPLLTTPPLPSWEIIFCSNVENQLVCFMKLFLEEIAAH